MTVKDGAGVLTTFHGRVYGNKKVHRESDLPSDLTNASAATRPVFDPAPQASKLPTRAKRYGHQK